MGWVCEFCSTSNEDDNKECFVCGHDKPIDYEAIRRKKEEKFNYYDVIFTKKIYGITRGLFIVTASFLFVCFIIYLIVCIMREDINKIGGFFIVSANRINDRLFDNYPLKRFFMTVIDYTNTKGFQVTNTIDILNARGDKNITIVESSINSFLSSLNSYFDLKIKHLKKIINEIYNSINNKHSLLDKFF